MVWLPFNVPATGAAVTVTVLVAVALLQPPVPVTVYVINEVPAETPVTTPVLGSTVATLVVAEVNTPPLFPFDTNVVVPFEHICAVPLKLPAFGAAVTVTVLVSVALAQPPVPTLV